MAEQQGQHSSASERGKFISVVLKFREIRERQEEEGILSLCCYYTFAGKNHIDN